MRILISSTLLIAMFLSLEGRARDRIEQDRPRNVIVDTIDFDGAKIVLRGHSENVNAVANFVENVKNDAMFTTPELMYVQVRKNSSPAVYEFEFRFAIKE
jgi:Tfp pilus assembly protein PilN